MCIILTNNLDVDFNAYFRFGDDQNKKYRGAGHRCDNDKYASRVRTDDYLPLDDRGLGEEYDLILVVEDLLARSERKGIRVSPGSKLGIVHDINFLAKGNKLIVTINFDNKSSSKSSPEIQHKDPRVHHPDELKDTEILD